MRIATALILATASQAHAERVETFPLISLPLTLGGHRTIEDGAFSWGLRPEVIASRVAEDGYGWGAGGYVQLERADGNTLYAAGVTLVGYAAGSAVAASVGYYEREGDTGAQASLFFGPRGKTHPDVPLDLPYGLRVDVQLGEERTLIVSAQFDTAPLFVVVGGIAAALSGAAH